MDDKHTFQLKGIYLVVGHQEANLHGLDETIVDAVHGGISMIQIREKLGDTQALVEQAKSIKSYLSGKNIPLIINDRIDIALKSGADGVHLGQSDLPPEDARELLGPKAIIGLTVNSLAQLEKGDQSTADYLACGSVFPTVTKKNISAIWGIEELSKARKMTSKPLFAIGGINENNLAEVAATGVDGIAVISAICQAQNVEKATGQLVSLFHKHSP